MIVVAIIGLLSAIAIPGIAKARQTSQIQRCIQNQRLIFQSVHRYEIDYNKTLFSIRESGVTIRETLVNAGYMKPRTSFDCPISPVKDYDDYNLVYTDEDFITTQCLLQPSTHILP